MTTKFEIGNIVRLDDGSDYELAAIYYQKYNDIKYFILATNQLNATVKTLNIEDVKKLWCKGIWGENISENINKYSYYKWMSKDVLNHSAKIVGYKKAIATNNSNIKSPIQFIKIRDIKVGDIISTVYCNISSTICIIEIEDIEEAEQDGNPHCLIRGKLFTEYGYIRNEISLSQSQTAILINRKEN